MDVSEATLLLENAFREAFRGKRHTHTPSYAASLASIRAGSEALTVALKGTGATPEAVVLELKRIARTTTGGFDYLRELATIAMNEAIATYFKAANPKPT
jgi:hypothetical protein